MGFERVCRRLLEYGILAPSVYNTQPWKFLVDGQKGIIEVRADFSRTRSREIDEKQRDLYLALGACVESMILAAPALGYEVELSMFTNERVVASLKLKPMTETLPESLFTSLLIRQTHAGFYKENSVQELHLERLRNVPAFSARERLHFLNSEKDREKLISLLHDLSHEEAGNSTLVEEAVHWIKPQPDALEGLLLRCLGLPVSIKMRFAFLRHFSYAREIKEVARQALLKQGHGAEAPAYLLMTTQMPERESYFNAGRWYIRLALTLSEIELGAQVLHLPTTLKRAHPSLLKLFKASHAEEPVLLLRFGQPADKKWPKTYRQPLFEKLIDA